MMPMDPIETRIVEHGLGTATNCIVCGGPLDPRASSGDCHTTFGSAPLDDDIDCFSFHFWSEKFTWRKRGDIVVGTPRSSKFTIAAPVPDPPQYALRIDGTHYAVQNVMFARSSGFMGFGGSVMYAEVTEGPHTGLLIKANNWWCQGGIPIEWRLMLPDNARFIDKEEYDRLIVDQLLP